MGKKRSTKATTSIQPYVGPELPDTPEQREVDQDQTTGPPAQQAVASPSETAAENDKSPNRRLKSIFRDPMAELARKMQAAHDKQISDCWQKIQAASQPWLESLDTPEQREVDQDQTTGSPRLAFWNFDTLLNRKANQDQPTDSPAQQAVASPSPSPSKPATIQAATTKRNVKRKNDAMASWCIDRRNDGWPWKKIVEKWNKDNPPEHPVDALTERKGSQAAYNYRERLKNSQDNKQ
jgi:hypothetical protein